MGRGNAYRIFVGRYEGKRPRGIHRWEDRLDCILREQDEKAWTGFIWLRIGTSDGLL
jgi:hypothetical protein